MNRLADAAERYAQLSWYVLPVYGIVEGQCTCGQGESCSSPGKHPRIPAWQNQATTDVATIRRWWKTWPHANIGVVAGKSGLVVLDIDPKHGGDESLESLIAEHGALPDTREQVTGSGGRHILFKHPGGRIQNRQDASAVAPGIDAKGDAGFFVAAPSLHASGKRYQWDGLEDTGVAELPEWLKKKLVSGSPNGKASVPGAQKVEKGHRHPALLSYAGRLRRAGCGSDEILSALRDFNRRWCVPPKPESEVRKLAEDVAQRYLPDGFRFSDLANAELLVKWYGEDLRYCHIWRKWLVWDGRRWKVDDSGAVNRRAVDTVRMLHGQAARIADAEQRTKLAQWAVKCENRNRLEAMVALAQNHAEVVVQPDQLDTDPWLICVENGVVDLRTGKLRNHDRADLISKLAPVRYRPNERADRWRRFLKEIFEPHPDLIPFIQRAIGYSLTGSTRDECLFLLYGTGRNGKGTLLKKLGEAMGDYACTADFSTFVQRRDDSGPRDDIAHMAGKRFVSAQESREGAALAESLIKWLTGGDRVRARRLYENSWEFDPTHKIWLATNHKPIVRGTDPAIWSRIRLIPFDVSFEGREDRDLKDTLAAELEGILSWAVQGCLLWQEHGLAFPQSVTAATTEYRRESDPVGGFIDERCVVGEYAQARARGLYVQYKQWADGSGEDKMTATAFGLRLVERGFRKTKDRTGLVYQGMGYLVDSSSHNMLWLGA